VGSHASGTLLEIRIQALIHENNKSDIELPRPYKEAYIQRNSADTRMSVIIV
jgi:hypothetical protein